MSTRARVDGVLRSACFFILILAVSAVSGQVGPAAANLQGDAAMQYRAVLDKYCIACHSQRLATAGIVLEKVDLTKVPSDAQLWEKVIRRLRGGSMPPQGMPHPTPELVDQFAGWLEGTLDRAYAAKPVVGRNLIHRLNRAEYANAIRDLLDLNVDVTPLLPADNSSYGFDNNADVLKTSPLLIERYLSAAMKISSLAIGDPDTEPVSDKFPIRLMFRKPSTSKVCPRELAGERWFTIISRWMLSTSFKPDWSSLPTTPIADWRERTFPNSSRFPLMAYRYSKRQWAGRRTTGCPLRALPRRERWCVNG